MSTAPDSPSARKATNRLALGIVAAIVVGALLGGLAPDVGVRLKLLGTLFINALMMIVVPLVIASLITGITGLGDIRKLGSIGRHTIVYYLITTGLSVVIGILLVNVIRPGVGVPRGEDCACAYRVSGKTVALGQSLRRSSYDERYAIRLVDQGVVGTIERLQGPLITVRTWTNAEGVEVKPESVGKGVAVELAVAAPVGARKMTAGEVLTEVITGLVPRNLFAAMAQNRVLPLIVFSLLLGAVLTTLGERGKPAIEFFRALNDAIMAIVRLIMKIAPFGILGLIAARIGEAGGFAGFGPELLALGKYFATVVTGLALHGIVILPLILWLIGRRAPWAYARNVAAPLLNAFSTASSSATLPLTMQAVEERNGISNRTASFVLPLGATINMDGTALYEAVAAIFIAQAFGIQLSLTHMIIVFLTATLASIGAAGIPEAGLVTMLIVLNAVHLPVEGIALLLTIDWLLDRFRTTVNVWGDAVGSGVVETLEQRAATVPTGQSG